MATSTLQKAVLFSAPDPGTPDIVTPRSYTTTRSVPTYKRVPTMVRAEADVILFPHINAAMVQVEGATQGSPNGRYANNWYKLVIDGYRQETVVVTENVVTPGRPPGAPTPTPPAWDATAWSIEALQDPMAASFTLGTGPIGGLRAGLTYRPVDAGSAETHIAHGFKIEGGLAYAITAPPPGSRPSATTYEELHPYLPVQPGDELRIELVGGRVSYFVQGTLMAVHPSYMAQNPVRLAAALYTNTDTILNPAIEALDNIGDGTLKLRLVAQGGIANSGKLQLRVQARGGHADAGMKLRLFAQGTDGEPGYGTARLRMPTASGFGYTGTDMTGTAKLLQGIAALGADSAYAGGGARLALAIIAQTDELVPEIGTFAAIGTQWLESTASFPHGGFHSEALGGVAFDGAVSPGVPLRAAGRIGTSLKASLRVLEALHTAGALSGDMRGTTVLDVALVAGAAVGLPLTGVLIVTGRIDADGVVDAGLWSGRTTDVQHDAAASADLQLTPQQILTAALQALGHIGAEMGMPGQNVSVWSVNAETGASAAYEDYPFNSFATIGGRHFGAASDGIYELVGDDDAGVPIQAHMNLGKRNFGTSKLKAMPYAYLGVASDGLMVVRVTTEGASYTYKARAASAEMQTQRVDFGRGLRANYFTLELMNENGADFDLDVIELAATPLTRRI